MCANSEGSGKTAWMRRLVWAFAGRPCDKHHNLMSWFIWCLGEAVDCMILNVPIITFSSTFQMHVNISLEMTISSQRETSCLPWQRLRSNVKVTNSFWVLVSMIWRFCLPNKPAREIMVLFVLRKLILQTCMCSYPVGLEGWLVVRPFIYFCTTCVRTAKALAHLSLRWSPMW